MSVDWIFFKYKNQESAKIESQEIIDSFNLNVGKNCKFKETIYKYNTFLDFSDERGFAINRPYREDLLPCIFKFLQIEGTMMHDTDRFHIANLETMSEMDDEIDRDEVTYSQSIEEFYKNIHFKL